MKPCMEYLELMNAVLDGEAASEQVMELGAHLARCPACAALYEDLKALRAGSDALIAKAPENLKVNVMSRIAAGDSNAVPFPAPAKKKSAGRWRSWAAMAALFALVIGAGGTQNLFSGGSSSSPNLAAAPSIRGVHEQEEAGGDIAEGYRAVADSDVSFASEDGLNSVFSSPMHDYATTNESLEDQASGGGVDYVENAASKTGEPAAPAESVPEQELSGNASPPLDAMELVLHRIYGGSGYTLETAYSDDGPSSCRVRLLDGETVIDEGQISYTGLSPNGKFHCFVWSREGQSAEDAALCRYAVPLSGEYVLWYGDVLDDGDSFRAALGE